MQMLIRRALMLMMVLTPNTYPALSFPFISFSPSPHPHQTSLADSALLALPTHLYQTELNLITLLLVHSV